MSTYVLMRILESAPERYDLGMRMLTLGGLDKAYDRLASHIVAGQSVLDIGCGTGALTIRAARRGATVKAIDVSAQILETARRRARAADVTGRIDFEEKGVAELDSEAPEICDVVTSGLCFSELSDDEIRYTLEQVKRILRPGGLLLVADEARPSGVARRIIHALARAPLVAITYLLTQQTTHAVKNLPARIADAGLTIESVRSNMLGSFIEVVARKPA